MIPFLRPLFEYKKYILCQKIIDRAKKEFMVVTLSDREMYGKAFANQSLKHDLTIYKKSTPERLLECYDLLKENGHIKFEFNSDYYAIMYECTISGERASNHGFYVKKVYAFMSVIAGLPIVGYLLTKLPVLLKHIHIQMCHASLF